MNDNCSKHMYKHSKKHGFLDLKVKIHIRLALTKIFLHGLKSILQPFVVDSLGLVRVGTSKCFYDKSTLYSTFIILIICYHT